MSDSEDEGAFQSADEGEGKRTAAGRAHPKHVGKKSHGAQKTTTAEGSKRRQEAKPQKAATQPRNTAKTSKSQPARRSKEPSAGHKGKSEDKMSASLVSKSKTEDTSDAQVKDAESDLKTDAGVKTDLKTDAGVKTDFGGRSNTVEKRDSEGKQVESFTSKEDGSATDSSPITESDSTVESASTNSYVADSEPLSPDTDVSDDVEKLTPSARAKEPSKGEKDNIKSPSQLSITRGSERDETSDSDSVRAKEARRALDKLTEDAEKPKASGGWGSWGSWGSNLLNTATSSVTTFTSQVGEGFQTVLDTVESSLVEPEPEVSVSDDKPETEETSDNAHSKQTDIESDEPDTVVKGADKGQVGEGQEGGAADAGSAGASSGAGGGGWLSWGGITNIVKDTGKNLVTGGEKLVSGGLDMLENTGQKIATGGEKIIGGGINVIEKTGKSLVTGGEKVIGGGLNVLETIGKKTYGVIAEGDHGLKKTLRTKPNLSQTLREAKEDAESKARMEAEYEEARKAHFGALFDDYNGLVHLEALETVSNQCEGRVQNMLMVLGSDELSSVKHELIIVKEIFQIEEQSDDDEADDQKDGDEDHDFDQQVTHHLENLGLNISPTKLIEAHHKSRLWLKDCADEQNQGVKMNAKACKGLAMYDGLRKRNISEEIHQMAIQTLAELTAVSVQQFHKVAQLMQMKPAGSFSIFKSKSTCLFNLTRTIGKEVDFIAEQFTHRLNKAAEDAENPDSVNPFITNVYLEASNSKTYIQDAFQLLLPVLQHAALRANAESS